MKKAYLVLSVRTINRLARLAKENARVNCDTRTKRLNHCVVLDLEMVGDGLALLSLVSKPRSASGPSGPGAQPLNSMTTEIKITEQQLSLLRRGLHCIFASCTDVREQLDISKVLSLLGEAGDTLAHAKTLSPEQSKAYEIAERHGGRLVRHSGGYWGGPTPPENTLFIDRSQFVGTRTVQAMIDHGHLCETAWKRTHDGHSFCVAADLVEQ